LFLCYWAGLQTLDERFRVLIVPPTKNEKNIKDEREFYDASWTINVFNAETAFERKLIVRDDERRHLNQSDFILFFSALQNQGVLKFGFFDGCPNKVNVWFEGENAKQTDVDGHLSWGINPQDGEKKINHYQKEMQFINPYSRMIHNNEDKNNHSKRLAAMFKMDVLFWALEIRKI